MTGPVWEDMVTVGRIVRPQGHKGQVVVASETDFGTERFRAGATVWWLRAAGPESVALTDSRPHGGRWVVGLEGVQSMDAAEALRGVELRVPAATLRPLGPQTYYVHELAGCRVETADGRKVGTVGRVDFGSGTPILVVLGAGREVLVPMAEEICRRIDVSAKVIVIDPPEGLIDLN